MLYHLTGYVIHVSIDLDVLALEQEEIFTLGVLFSSVSGKVCTMIIKHTFESSNLSF